MLFAYFYAGPQRRGTCCKSLMAIGRQLVCEAQHCDLTPEQFTQTGRLMAAIPPLHKLHFAVVPN